MFASGTFPLIESAISFEHNITHFKYDSPVSPRESPVRRESRNFPGYLSCNTPRYFSQIVYNGKFDRLTLQERKFIYYTYPLKINESSFGSPRLLERISAGIYIRSPKRVMRVEIHSENFESWLNFSRWRCFDWLYCRLVVFPSATHHTSRAARIFSIVFMKCTFSIVLPATGPKHMVASGRQCVQWTFPDVISVK